MDNAVQAMYMAFAVFVLGLGLSFGLYMIGLTNRVSEVLIENQDVTKDYEKVSYDASSISDGTATNNNPAYRYVGKDTIISTLYKYYKESFSVEIYDKNKQLKQLFDLSIENIVGSPETITDKLEYEAYMKRYGPSATEVNLFGAPWRNDTKYIKQRIDMYISGKAGYINGTYVDYERSGLNSFNGNMFMEQFIQYSFDGETYSEKNGEDIETITGSTKANKKIIIRYTEI